MQDHIHRTGEQREVGDDRGAHATFDPVAIVRFAESLGNSETDARTRSLRTPFRGTRRKEVRHIPGELFTARRVGVLIICVLSQPMREGHTSLMIQRGMGTNTGPG